MRVQQCMLIGNVEHLQRPIAYRWKNLVIVIFVNLSPVVLLLLNAHFFALHSVLQCFVIFSGRIHSSKITTHFKRLSSNISIIRSIDFIMASCFLVLDPRFDEIMCCCLLFNPLVQSIKQAKSVICKYPENTV